MPNLKPLLGIIVLMVLAVVGLQVLILVPTQAASTCPTPASSARVAAVTACPSISPSLEPTISTPIPSDPATVLPPTTGGGSGDGVRFVQGLVLGISGGVLLGLIIGSFVMRVREID